MDEPQVTAQREPSRIKGLLAHLPLYEGLPDRPLSELASRARVFNVGRGTPVARRGVPLPGLISVSYGLVKLAVTGPRGEERVLRLLGAGEDFGVAAIMLGQPSPLDAVSLADTLLVAVPAAPIFELVEREPKFAHRLLLVLAQRNLGLISEFAHNALQRGVQRLASYLDSLAQRHDGSGRLFASLPVAKGVVASRLGMKKETLSRLLHGLAQAGLVGVNGREIEILDRARLSDIAYKNASAACCEDEMPALNREERERFGEADSESALLNPTRLAPED